MNQMILFITFYQKFISPALKQLLGIQSMCKFTPSCSEYAKLSIITHGLLKGSFISFMRLLQCQPFLTYKSGKSFIILKSI